MPFNERWLSKFQIKPNSWVFVPTPETINYGESVKSLIETCWSSPEYYYHLRNGGHVSALRSHISHRYFIHLDIKNFFGCINRSRVTRVIKQYVSYADARKIANASTVRDPEENTVKYILPFGFVQSPIIASISLHKSKFGKYLDSLNKRNNLVVSIYMDDIIISGNEIITLQEILDESKILADKSGFKLNSEKEEGPAEIVTAFNIELSYCSLKINSNRLSQFFSSYMESTSKHQRLGIIGYVSSVNQLQANELRVL